MEGERAGRRAAVLAVAACIVLVSAWLAYPPVGPFIALSGGMLGWLLARAWPAATAPAATPLPAPAFVEPEDTSVTIRALRHDLRGILSPAMLIADRLQSHADPAVQRAGAVVMRTVERAAARLAETKEGQGALPPGPKPGGDPPDPH
jgi:hypothetical protein